MSEPLNKPGSVRFFLNFNDNRGDVEIAELWGWDGSIFEMLQEDDRLGRDVFFAKTELGFRAEVEINNLTHRFDEILQRYRIDGFESNILFIFTIEGIRYVVGELDFVESVTDEYTYFNCKVIQQADEVALKRKIDVNIDLFSTVGTNGQKIAPVNTSKLLWKATPLEQVSTWRQPKLLNWILGSPSPTGIFWSYLSPTTIPVRQEIDTTLPPENGSYNGEFTNIITAPNTLTECVLTIKTVGISITANDFGLNTQSYTQARLRIEIGTDVDNIERSILLADLYADGTNTDTLPDTTFVESFVVPRNQQVFVYWWFTVNGANQPFVGIFSSQNMTIEAKSLSLSISSVITTVRFIDAFRQVVDSIGGYTVIAPRFDIGGEYYDQWITNGKLLRQIQDEPFNVSLKSLLSQLQEINGDYQILDSNTIFLGIYEDFYKDIDLVGSSLIMPPNASFEKVFSDKYTINEVKLKAKKYEEDTNEQGSRFGIHSEIDVLIDNQRAENTKDVVVEYIRDGFLIEKVRKEAILVNEDTASIDDEEIMIIDGVYEDHSFSENMKVIAIASSDVITDLSLVNDNTFNWTLLGLVIGQSVQLTESHNNGWYNVISIVPSAITLRKIVPAPVNAITEGITFNYSIGTLLTQRIEKGFQNMGLPFYANGIFSNKRVLRKYYGSYMKSAALYCPNSLIRTQRYIHNAQWVSLLNTELLPIIEGENIDPTILDRPLVYPVQITTEVIAEFSVFWTLIQSVRSLRGYVSIKDNLGNTIKIYPSSLVYDWANNLLTMTGLQKYEL